jgi:RimJ/RimL family protein N-acetyltransferase
VLEDADRVILIGTDDGEPVGVVRFDVIEHDAEVSIYLSPERHPPGAGTALLEAAERWFASARPEVRRWRATVLAGNVPSHRLFTSAGYVPESHASVKDRQAL